MDDYPKFERRDGEGVSLLIRDYDELGNEVINRHHYSEATASRILEELESAVKMRNT